MTVDELFKKITLIRGCSDDIEFTASGFFWKSSDETYLITNKHVVKPNDGISPDSLIIDFRKRHSPEKITCESIDLADGDGGSYKILNDRHTPDITAIPLPNIDFNNKGNAAFTAEDIISREEKELSVGNSAMIVGYPSDGGYPIKDDRNASSVGINALVSSQFGDCFDDNPMFLVDAQTYDGMSGSPVLLQPGTPLFDLDASQVEYLSASNALLGIHSGHYDVSREVSLNRVWYADLIPDLVDE
jgi:hypothetical protein